MRSEPIRWEIRTEPPRKKGKDWWMGWADRGEGQVEERGKSVTACFNTWNACDFEVDKPRQSSRGDAFDCFSRISRRWVIDVSVIGHEVIGGVCALCSARMKQGIAVSRRF